MFLVRQHAVAGAFYPEQRQALSRDLRAMLDAAWPASASALPAPKAIVVPHAGYIYLQTVLDDFTLLLLAASRHQLKPQLLGLCNSGDTAGDRSRVVGYAAIALVERPRHVH